MLQINFIKEQKTALLAGLKKRGFGPEGEAIVDRVLALDVDRISTQQSLEELLGQVKSISAEIGQLFKTGKAQEANARKAEVGAIKEKAQVLQEQMKSIQAELEENLLKLPNHPHDSVPAGTTEADNEVFQDWPNPLPEMPEGALPHWELAKKYDVFDLELA